MNEGVFRMELLKTVGLNTKWYRYQKSMTQETFADITGFKMAYISIVENGEANLTLNNLSIIAKALGVKPKDLLDEDNAKKAVNLPKRVYMYKKD